LPEPQASSIAELEDQTNSPKRALRLGTPSLVGGFIQGACALLMATNAGKALLGIATTTVAARSSFIHSDPVRIPLMIVSAFGAMAVLYVLWNGWRLRNSSSARWRRQPLSKRERWSIGFSLTCSVITLALVVGEYFAHPIMHPR
jgi:hypothetical protein